jgi:hypothetical protein
MRLKNHAPGANEPLIRHSIYPPTIPCSKCHGFMYVGFLDQRPKSQVDLIVYNCESCHAVETLIAERDITSRN